MTAKQPKTELQEMADFYATYCEKVYFVRDLTTDLIIAVECVPVGAIEGAEGVRVERHGEEREIFGYQGLFLTTRERVDKTPDGAPMIGFEALTGNDTRLGPSEIIKDDSEKESEIAQDAVLSPFERLKQGKTIAAPIMPKKYTGYEKTEDENGFIHERYDSFKIERVR